MNRQPQRMQKQRGFTLVELLVSVVISLIVVSGMIIMMSTTVGATNDTIRATRLSNELRASMQVLVRDLRRVNFDEDFASCIGIGNQVCAALSADAFTIDTTNANGECVSYTYRRQDSGGTWATVQGAIRLDSQVLQFNPVDSSCADSNNWNDITDPGVVQITAFDWTDLGYVETTGNLSQNLRKFEVIIRGQICESGPLTGCSSFSTRELRNTVRIRNAVFYATPAPAVAP